MRTSTMRYFLLVCWLLSLTGMSSPGRSAPMTLGALDPIALTKLAVRGLAFAVLGLILLRYNQSARSATLLRRLFPLILFSGWAVASIWWSAIRTVTSGHAGDLVLLVMLSGAAGFLTLAEEDYRRVFAHLTTIAILVSVLLMALNLRTILAGGRPTGYMQPNDMAKTAGAGLIMLACCHGLWDWSWTRKLLAPAVLVLATALIVAQSRTATILTPLFLLPVCWRFRKTFTLIAVFVMIGLLAAMAPYSEGVLHLPETAAAYLARGQTAGELTGLSGRTEMWTIALRSFQDAPLFGHGYYMMTEAGVFQVWGKRQWQTAHNAFLHVLTGLGLIGTAFLGWGLAAAVRPCLSALRDLGQTRKVEFLALVMIAWYCAMGMFELSFFGPIDTAVVTFFVLLGVSAGRPAQGW